MGLAGLLNDLLAMETRSLIRHLDEAQPYLSSRTYPVWAKVQETARASQDHERRLTDMILQLGFSPSASVFEVRVANYHFCDLPTLLGLLIGEKKLQVEAYQQARRHPEVTPDVQEELGKLLADAKGQLELFESQLRVVGS